jgi:hypothetical protein
LLLELVLHDLAGGVQLVGEANHRRLGDGGVLDARILLLSVGKPAGMVSAESLAARNRLNFQR